MALRLSLAAAMDQAARLDLDRCERVGGYLDLIVRVGRTHVVVAGLDHDGEPRLDVFTNAQFIRHAQQLLDQEQELLD